MCFRMCTAIILVHLMAILVLEILSISVQSWMKNDSVRIGIFRYCYETKRGELCHESSDNFGKYNCLNIIDNYMTLQAHILFFKQKLKEKTWSSFNLPCVFTQVSVGI